LLEFSLDRFALENVAVQGSDLSLGGIEVEGPVLRVRRDLVLADTSQSSKATTARDAPQAVAAQEAPQAAAASDKAPQGATAKDAPQAAASENAPAAAAASDKAPQPVANENAPAGTTVEHAPAASTTGPAGGAAIAERKTEVVTTDGAAVVERKPAGKTGYRIAKIDIQNAKFTWITDQGPVDVALALKASDVTMDEGRRFPLDLQLRIGQGDVAIAGEVGILPPAYHGKFHWGGLPFPPLLLAALPQFTPWLRSANSSGDLTIDVDLGGDLRISGRTSVQALAIADPDGEKALLGWNQLDVVAREVTVPLSPQGKPHGTTRVVLDSVKLVEPKIRYTRPTPVLDALFGLAPPVQTAGAVPPVESTARTKSPAHARAGKKDVAGTAAADRTTTVVSSPPAGATADVAVSPVDLSIASLELAAGEVELIDNAVTPPVRSQIRDLTLTASSVHFPDPSASAIRVHALLPTTATLTVEGDLRPGNNGDFKVSLQKLDLPVFSPYASGAGATLDAGQASVKMKVRLRGAVTELDNDLLLRKFGVSMHDPDSFERSFGVPIDLALALLRDPAGDIELRIPVRIDQKGASVSMGAVIASAMRQALIGAVTAPLKLLGAVFGAGSEAKGFSIDPVASVPGTADVAAGQQGRTDGLVTLLAKRPQVGVSLRGRTGPEDLPLVAEQILVETQQAGKSLPSVKDSGFLARRRVVEALARKAKGKAPGLSAEDQALYERYVAAVQVPPERMRALATSRAQRVRALLIEKQVADNRIHVGEPEAEGAPAVVIGLKTK